MRAGRLAVALAYCAVAFPAVAQPPTGAGRLTAPAEGEATEAAPTAAPAPDVLHLRNGNTVRGYVKEATDTRVVLIKEMRRGSFSRATLPRSSVARIVYAPPTARAALKARIDWWESKKQRDALAASRFTPQRSTEHEGAWEATGPYFRIVCDVDTATTRELAFRLNTMYEVWSDVFRRNVRGTEATTMFVVGNIGAYRQSLLAAGVPAHAATQSGGIYFPPPADVSVVPIRHVDPRAVEAQVREFERRYGDRVDPVWWARQKRSLKSQLATDRALQISTAYHEGMHAFIHKELFPGRAAVPTWLNEGMATYVMMQREDMHGLRTQARNPEMYPIAVGALHAGQLPGIRALVARAESITEHDTGRTAAAFYAASWSLVYFLNNDRGALGTDMYARYVDALEDGSDPVAAFQAMTGEALAATETAWHAAMKTWK